MRRVIFLIHRWTAIVLGVLVFAWFVSGIALAYYPWPLLTESAQNALAEPFQLTQADTVLLGFRESSLRAPGGRAAVVGGRLERRNGSFVYELWGDEHGSIVPIALLDAHTGAPLTPLSRERAIALAAAAVPGRNVRAAGADLLDRGDQYMLSAEYERFFPAWRVRFDDPAATAIYVSRDRGNVFGRVTTRTRVITWIGVVPHWLYFPWLYRHPALWRWLNILLPAFAVLIAITGLVWGTWQLLPLRVDGRWRASIYRGTSKWHHVAGIVFGVFVLTWTVSGVLEMFGADNSVRPGQGERVRAGSIVWTSLLLREPMATFQAAPALGGEPGVMGTTSPPLLWITLAQLQGRPGYEVHLASGADIWIDAANGQTREEIDATDAAEAALSVLPSAAVLRVDRLSQPDFYYYARPGREVHFPVYRVVFDDAQRSRLYLNTITGAPTGFVDGDTRAWRWWRDAMHSWDFPGLNGKRPLWDVVVLTLLLGGVVSSGTGLWMAVRRLRRVVRG